MMRRILDEQGGSWDVVVGRESWGTLYALFVPAGPAARQAVRQALLQSAGYEQAQQELDAMDESALRALFRVAQPREPR